MAVCYLLDALIHWKIRSSRSWQSKASFMALLSCGIVAFNVFNNHIRSAASLHYEVKCEG